MKGSVKLLEMLRFSCDHFDSLNLEALKPVLQVHESACDSIFGWLNLDFHMKGCEKLQEMLRFS